MSGLFLSYISRLHSDLFPVRATVTVAVVGGRGVRVALAEAGTIPRSRARGAGGAGGEERSGNMLGEVSFAPSLTYFRSFAPSLLRSFIRSFATCGARRAHARWSPRAGGTAASPPRR